MSTMTPELLKRASACEIEVYAHPNSDGYILCDSTDDFGKTVRIEEREDFLSTVVVALKTYRMRDSFFVAVNSEATAVTELTAHLDFLEA